MPVFEVMSTPAPLSICFICSSDLQKHVNIYKTKSIFTHIQFSFSAAKPWEFSDNPEAPWGQDPYTSAVPQGCKWRQGAVCVEAGPEMLTTSHPINSDHPHPDFTTGPIFNFHLGPSLKKKKKFARHLKRLTKGLFRLPSRMFFGTSKAVSIPINAFII